MAAGPFLDDQDRMIGSLLIVDVPDEAAAKRFADGDPFAKAGLFASTEIRKWRWGVKPPKVKGGMCDAPLAAEIRARRLVVGRPGEGGRQRHALERREEPHRQAQHDGDEDGREAFFYHSNEGKAVVGVVEVIREAYPNPENGPRTLGCWSTSGRWRRFPKPVTLAEVKAETSFAKMSLVASFRLSVQPVTGGGMGDRLQDGRLFGRPKADTGAQAASSQFSTRNTRTRPNSEMLRVISVNPRAMAWPAISTSYGPIGMPASASAARISPAHRAAFPIEFKDGETQLIQSRQIVLDAAASVGGP